MMKLLQPIKIGSLSIKNRMVVSAMVTNYCREDGYPTEKFIAYHERKAKGGWGLIIAEDFCIMPGVGAFRRLPGLWEDAQIESFKACTDRVHAAGGCMFAQIYHAGRETTSAITGQQSVAPSPAKNPVLNEIPRELTVEEIHEIVSRFGECALRAKKAGFDGVEIHGAHGYLVNSFVSPFSNKRCDEYGGTIENRMRFAVEVVKEIRRVCGEEYPIIYRMSVREYVEGGLDLAESCILARALEQAGVDALHCSQGISALVRHVVPTSVVRPGAYRENFSAIKHAVSIPVIAVGRINDPLVAEDILECGDADLCTMARASLADPSLPEKVVENRCEDILHCIGCVQGCIGENAKGNFVRCLVNPMTGMEDEYHVEMAARPKTVVIAGGGIAGCEAAITAAMRGHHVHLLERGDRLGGQWIAAVVPPGKAEFSSFIVWQKQMLQKYHVAVHLNCEAEKDVIMRWSPDLVINATGSIAAIPPVSGLREFGVCAEDVLLGRVKAVKKAVVIGGGLVGAETADHLAMHGADVALIEMLPSILNDGEPLPKELLLERFQKRGVKVYTSAAVQSVTESCVRYRKDESDYVIEDVELVVIATGRKKDSSKQQIFEELPCDVVSVGDAASVKNGYLNIREGFEAGLSC